MVYVSGSPTSVPEGGMECVFQILLSRRALCGMPSLKAPAKWGGEEREGGRGKEVEMLYLSSNCVCLVCVLLRTIIILGI